LIEKFFSTIRLSIRMELSRIHYNPDLVMTGLLNLKPYCIKNYLVGTDKTANGTHCNMHNTGLELKLRVTTYIHSAQIKYSGD
jgi:hypothetical protein